MDRVRIIERSLRCYYAGWWSLLPIVGLAPAVTAFYLFGQIRRELEGGWNPAGAYLRWGILLAAVGASISVFLLLIPLWERLL